MKISCSLHTLTSQCSPLKSTLRCTRDLSCLLRRPEIIDQSDWFLPTTKLASKTVIYFWNSLNTVMQVSISSKTILPPGQTPGDDLKGAKALPPGQSLCTKALPLGQNRESKAPPLGPRVSKFYKYIYKLFYYLKWKALWSQQIKWFSMRRLIIKVYIIWRSPESKCRTYKSFIWYA